MKRYIVTIADDDPTLAAQAHAAILAVVGVVSVVDVGPVAVSVSSGAGAWREAMAALPSRWAAEYQQAPHPRSDVGDTVLVMRNGREERAVLETFSDGGAEVRFDSDGRGRWVHRWTVPAASYTVTDEDDGAP